MTITQPGTSQQSQTTRGEDMTTTVFTPQTNIAPQPDLARLRGRLTGELITAGHAEFDEARKVHDITVDRRPLAIVRAANAEDVVGGRALRSTAQPAAGGPERRAQRASPQHRLRARLSPTSRR